MSEDALSTSKAYILILLDTAICSCVMFIKRSRYDPLENVLYLRQHTLHSLLGKSCRSPNTTRCFNDQILVHRGDALTRKLLAILENHRQKGRLIEPANPQMAAQMAAQMVDLALMIPFPSLLQSFRVKTFLMRLLSILTLKLVVNRRGSSRDYSVSARPGRIYGLIS